MLISKYFTLKEALWLREWNRMATAEDGLTDEVLANIKATAAWLDQVREFLGKPLVIRSWYRPKAYNIAIGGAGKSLHMSGCAVDFWTDHDGDGDKDGADCDAIKSQLMPKLAEWELRLEDNGKSARWIHMDSRPTTGKRFFKP